MTSVNDRKKLTGEMSVSGEAVRVLREKIHGTKDIQRAWDDLTGTDITAEAELVFVSAIALGASDIHMEPEEESVKIRFRLDGLLRDGARIDRQVFETLLSRIKLASGLKLNIQDRPQDGRFSLLIEGESPIEIRTSTLPSEYGETLVMRVLNPKDLIRLEDLGLRKDLLEFFSKELQKPNGMIVVTGPTGSGKTTTLYAFLKEVQNPELKIVTIEDPIEYHLEGISQTQARPDAGYDFASGLRAIVRQDPDVILVGEIRDGETAHIALQAALTGHLVFSTLHTNDAAGTVARLQSLGAETNNIAAAVNVIIAQRLVRKICPFCATKEPATKDELRIMEEATKGLKGSARPSFAKHMDLPRAHGCDRCNGTGYKGRIGIFEAMALDEKMEKFILSNPSTSSLKAFAVDQGMITMLQDGILKVIEGATTLDEVTRVTEE